ncbi:MAG: hypothetical protein WB424_05545 [Terracidiphilus sp.]
MKLPSGNIHLFRPYGRIQYGKLFIQPPGMAGLNSGLRTGLEELLDALVPEAAYHSASSVQRNVTLYK